MRDFILENPSLFTDQDLSNFVQVGYINQDDYNALMNQQKPANVQATAPSENALNSEVNSDSNVASNASN